MLVPVYDILNCGPRHRFVANGKLVHNSDKLNFQNLKRGGVIRDSVEAPEGHEFVVSDLSQIEFRITLLLAGHMQAMIRMAEGACLYSELGTVIFGELVTKELAKIDSVAFQRRFIAKGTLLGSGFGLGPPRLVVNLAGQGVKVTAEFGRRAIETFRATYPGVPRLWRVLEACFLKLTRDGKPFDIPMGDYTCHFGFEPLFGMPGIRLPNGLWIKYPELELEEGFYDEEGKWVNVHILSGPEQEAVFNSEMKLQKQWMYTDAMVRRKIWGGHFLENLVQALARIIIMEKTVYINKFYPVVMSTHDEIAAVVANGDIEIAKDFVQEVMTSSVDWMPTIRLGAETGSGKRYGEAK